MKKLLAFTAALLVLLGTNATLADDRNGWDNRRGNSHGFDRGRHDSGWDRRDRDNRRWNDRRYDRDRVSLSLSFGNVWRPGYYDRGWNNHYGFGVGYSAFDTWGYNNRRPVVVYQNTYVNPAPRTTVITRSSPRRSGTSLLRDVEGRCFERETDSYGNETRTELPAEACNF